jgi:hypothetical protein
VPGPAVHHQQAAAHCPCLQTTRQAAASAQRGEWIVYVWWMGALCVTSAARRVQLLLHRHVPPPTCLLSCSCGAPHLGHSAYNKHIICRLQKVLCCPLEQDAPTGGGVICNSNTPVEGCCRRHARAQAVGHGAGCGTLAAACIETANRSKLRVAAMVPSSAARIAGSCVSAKLCGCALPCCCAYNVTCVNVSSVCMCVCGTRGMAAFSQVQ